MLRLPIIISAFRKPTRPSLPLRKAPPFFSVFFNSLYDPFGSPCRGQKPQEKRGNRSTQCSEPLRYKVDGPSEVCARLCGMGPP